MSRALPRVASLLALSAVVAAGALAQAPSHYDQRMSAFAAEKAKLDPAKRHVVLVGDSLTEAWEHGGRIAKYLPAFADRVLGRGIGGDTTAGLLRRLDASVFDLNPSHVVLCMGVNDLGAERDVAPAAERYARIVHEVRTRLPDVPLILVTVAPARGRFAQRNPFIEAYDVQVRRIAQESGCPLIDLHALLADAKGELPEANATPDGLHWTDPTYELLGREIQRLVEAPAAPAGPR